MVDGSGLISFWRRFVVTLVQATGLCWIALLCAPILAAASPAKGPWVAPEPAAQQSNPLSSNKEAIARGKTLYQDRCVDCHGKKGKGDGPGAADLDSRPPDFSHPKVRQQTDGALFWKITEGRKPMPSYGRKLTDDERWALVAYLRSLSSGKI
jgi:mono/diheme cytochrome c family protein